MASDAESTTEDSVYSAETSMHTSQSAERDPVLHEHLQLLNYRIGVDQAANVSTAPIFTEAVRACHTSDGNDAQTAFTQYGLLGGQSSKLSPTLLLENHLTPDEDPRVYYNVASPSSAFICGIQGSGKSHTLSCLLENSLVPSKANVLPRPLTAVVFHYDTFVSDDGGSPCEAAFLSSNPSIRVRVVCAPTNVGQIKRIYATLPNVKVEELRLLQTDLNTKRMLDLMNVTTIGGSMPLYLHVVVRILRELRILQQKNGTGFDYGAFKRAIDAETMTREQLNPLQQRLETLESFMVNKEATSYDLFRPKPGAAHKDKKKKKGTPEQNGTVWKPEAGTLTIVDLSCPCVTPEMACAMFNMCLGLFLEQESTIGRVVALDEAHKYMDESGESLALTNSLLATIRLQRHLGTRVIIATQEPTISPKLLDLCTITIVHKFTSPEWLRALKKHLAGASLSIRPENADKDDAEDTGDDAALHDVDHDLLVRITGLSTGEALLFCPNALVGVKRLPVITAPGGYWTDGTLSGHNAATRVQAIRLGNGVMKIRIRKRVTADGGKSVMAA